MRADCVRIFGVQLTQDGFGSRYLQLAEFEVYAGAKRSSPAVLAVSSALSTWPKERLIDGDITTVWSSNGHSDHFADSEWAALLLPNSPTIDRMRIYPCATGRATDGFPKDFVLLTSENGNGHTCDPNDPRFAYPENWHSWASYAGYAQPSPGWLEFQGKAVRADCVRIFGVQLTQDGFGSRYLQLAEFEVYAK